LASDRLAAGGTARRAVRYATAATLTREKNRKVVNLQPEQRGGMLEREMTRAAQPVNPDLAVRIEMGQHQ